jgi:hypothetical protein
MTLEFDTMQPPVTCDPDKSLWNYLVDKKPILREIPEGRRGKSARTWLVAFTAVLEQMLTWYASNLHCYFCLS